jgi:hypothetical protein
MDILKAPSNDQSLLGCRAAVQHRYVWGDIASLHPYNVPQLRFPKRDGFVKLSEVPMWIFTTFGFYSVVQKEPSDAFLTVRARDPKDLDRLRERVPDLGPTELKGGDYCCRARVSRPAFANGLAIIASEIHYGNFKNAVQKSMGSHRAGIYHDIWTAAYEIQRRQRRSNNHC